SPPPQIPLPPLPPILSPPLPILSPAPHPSPIRSLGYRASMIRLRDEAASTSHSPEREIGYGITDSWDEIVETLQGAPVSTDTKLGGYVREYMTQMRST
nr:hypothetical protein [Tanacetum cinerariifolium]